LPSGLGIALVGFALVMINFAIDEISNPRLLARRRWHEKTRALGAQSYGITPVSR
jgi:peptide/nickel transport system permease protein